ncbi:MAG TPA: tRNA (guanosine(37)-N1)-methyltransferase TrmD [Verrucomicrobiae bacterium]|jgi:tRNA (guanine37-N1)-methyltransferase|nr:tRNA (guanosine(37)-N1)-methyltransferase TrmD [Verrucomicrobiae bacterium]
MGLCIDVVTLFPNFFKGPLEESILKRAQKNKLVDIRIHNLRKYTHDAHKTVDDKPFGGGAGMVIKPEPVFECLEDIAGDARVILLAPQGARFTQKKAAELASIGHFLLLAGHYEGFDYRIHEHLVDEEISVGDFVTMGGEAPALCIIEAVVRLLPGVLGNSGSLDDESFNSGHLEYPQYTRPRSFRGWDVPEILVSGNHKEVEAWRKREARKMTKERRPDLL